MTFASFQIFGTTLEESGLLKMMANSQNISEFSLGFYRDLLFVGLKRTEFVTKFIGLNDRDVVS
jgi:hypothetical protein